MADLTARSALASRRDGLAAASFSADGVTIMERTGLSAWLVTSRTQMDSSGAIVIGPNEHLFMTDDAPPDCPGTALVQDMASALTFIEVTGPDAFARIGLSTVANTDQGGAATRLADLRVLIAWRHTPIPWLRIAVDRFSADYLWQWLTHRLKQGSTA